MNRPTYSVPRVTLHVPPSLPLLCFFFSRLFTYPTPLHLKHSTTNEHFKSVLRPFHLRFLSNGKTTTKILSSLNSYNFVSFVPSPLCHLGSCYPSKTLPSSPPTPVHVKPIVGGCTGHEKFEGRVRVCQVSGR